MKFIQWRPLNYRAQKYLTAIHYADQVCLSNQVCISKGFYRRIKMNRVASMHSPNPKLCISTKSKQSECYNLWAWAKAFLLKIQKHSRIQQLAKLAHKRAWYFNSKSYVQSMLVMWDHHKVLKWKLGIRFMSGIITSLWHLPLLSYCPLCIRI